MGDQDADCILGEVDLPSNGQVVGHVLLVSGWAFSPDGEEPRIELAIDGKPIDWGRCGFPRYDVWSNYRSELAYRSGFLARVFAHELDNGPHQLEVTARIGGGRVQRIGTRVFIKEHSSRFYVNPLGGVGGQMRKGDHGARYVKLFKDLAGLAPHHDVLDIGCGMGGMALPLTDYLTSGTYHGLDNSKVVIDYCQAHITRRFPAFRFTHADIHNKMYNPSGCIRAADYGFPYSDESFDLVYLVSVFTHMLPDDFNHYLSEIARLLRSGGKCLATFFMLNAEVHSRIDKGQSSRSFPFQQRDCRADCKDNPEGAIAYEEQLVRRRFCQHQLEIQKPIHFGMWSGLKEGLDHQDVVIAERLARAQ